MAKMDRTMAETKILVFIETSFCLV